MLAAAGRLQGASPCCRRRERYCVEWDGSCFHARSILRSPVTRRPPANLSLPRCMPVLDFDSTLVPSNIRYLGLRSPESFQL